jgi:hypothetical protein
MPDKLTNAKTPPCTDLISEPEKTLKNKERWPIHLCDEEFLRQSTELWAEAQPFVIDSVNIHRWASMHSLPVGRQALIRKHEVDDVSEWSQVLSALPFNESEEAMWALRAEEKWRPTGGGSLDIFGLAEYPTEIHRELGMPVAGDLAYVVRGSGKDKALTDLLEVSKIWWAQFRGLIFKGRPKGTGTWKSREEFEAAVREAVIATLSAKENVTQENIASRLHTSDRQLCAWINHVGSSWQDIKKG